MTTKRNYKKGKNNVLKLCALFLSPFSLMGGLALSKVAKMPNKTFATDTYVQNYNEKAEFTNSNFDKGSIPYTRGDSLAGWDVIEKDSKALGMLIDVGQGSNTEEGNDTSTFVNNKDEYRLSTNPGSHGEDSFIMMINSREKENQKNNQTYKGYHSSSISLQANSYYVFSISAKAMTNGDDFVNGSIYISGLVDNDGKKVNLGFERFTNSDWKEYYFFVATGDKEQTVQFEVYLGTKTAIKSEGAVFFDNANITRYSENQFFSHCYNYGYKGEDVKFVTNPTSDNTTLFLINQFPSESFVVAGTEDFNFDFEDPIEPNSDTLGSHWKIIPNTGRNHASAQIVDMKNMQQNDFLDMTGYNHVGDDLSYNNKQALVLWTDNSYSSGGYIGVRSENLEIAAHGIYKVSLKMKIAGIESGSFYLKVTENENIYTYYPSYVSKDSEDKDYYELSSGQTAGISANVDNVWTNHYQVVEMYIRGNSLLNTSVNLELWLGDSTTPAKGCVVIDDIKFERSDYSTFTNASNKLDIQKASSSDEGFTNSKFDVVENSSKLGKYPLTASSWTTSVEDADINESGVLYLYDNAEYQKLYLQRGEDGYKEYEWAGINPNNTTRPNNVYMMFNSKNSYQSITSTTSSIEENSYYKINFDFMTQNYATYNPAKIKVEVIDENGITLFSQKGVSSEDVWSKFEVLIHTAETVSHTVQVKINLGYSVSDTEFEKVGGMVYLDNFNITTSTESAFNSATYKTDLSNYYLNLYTGEDLSDITTSPAYTSSSDQTNSGSRSGVVSGTNNAYNIHSDNNLLVITNASPCSSTLTSVYKIKLTSESYYELSFDLATLFGPNAGTSTKDHECKYGFSVTVDGYKAISGLISPDKLSSYKVYLKGGSSDSTPTIAFTLVSDCENTTGTALITNINFTPSDEVTYTELVAQSGYNDNLFRAEQDATTPEPDEEPDEPEQDDTDTSTDNQNSGIDSRWLLVSSIIMGVALVVAIVGFILRRIKIKKIERIRKESYDRKLSVNHDVFLAEAQKRRDKEVEDLQKAKNILIDEKDRLTEIHKEYVKEQRVSNSGKLSREDEHEFKKYNADIARLDEKINIIKEKIDNCMTPEYLITLERKIVAEEDDRYQAERKARKAMQKRKEDDED